MQHISITQKMMLIIGLLGLFVLGIAYYVSGQMRHIDDSYSDLMAGQSRGTLLMARANRAFLGVVGGIADMEIADTAAEDAAANTNIQQQVSTFKDLMDEAGTKAPAFSSRIADLKARAMDVVNNSCARAISLGAASDTDASTLAAQQEYLKNCAPAFPPVSAALQQAGDAVSTATDNTDNALTGVTNRTILITYGGIIGGLIVMGLLAVGGIRRWIIMPLRQQLDIMARLAGGDYSAEVPGVDRRDEVGAIARAVPSSGSTVRKSCASKPKPWHIARGRKRIARGRKPSGPHRPNRAPPLWSHLPRGLRSFRPGIFCSGSMPPSRPSTNPCGLTSMPPWRRCRRR